MQEGVIAIIVISVLVFILGMGGIIIHIFIL